MSLVPNKPVKITLYRNVPFSNDYKDHFYTNSRFTLNGLPNTSKASFEDILDFEVSDLIVGAYQFPRIHLTNDGSGFNFDLSNQLVAKLTLEIDDENSDFVQSNYVKIVQETGEFAYYFVTDVVQENLNVFTFNLECDVIATYSEEIEEGLRDKPLSTKRKHCKRYYHNENDNTFYPCLPEVMLDDDICKGYEPKQIERIEEIKHTYTDDEESQYILDNLKWVYLIFKGDTFDVYKIGSATKYTKPEGELWTSYNGSPVPFMTLAVPFMKDTLRWEDYEGHEVEVPNICFRTFTFQRNQQGEIINKTYYNSSVSTGYITPAGLLKKLIKSNKYAVGKVTTYAPFPSTKVTRPAPVITNVDMAILDIHFENIEISQGNSQPFVCIDIGWDSSIIGVSLASRTTISDNDISLSDDGLVVGNEVNNSIYPSSIEVDKLGYNEVAQPSYNNLRLRDLEPMLKTSPITKYKLKTQFTEPVQLYPDFMFSEVGDISETLSVDFNTKISTYAGDLTVFTWVEKMGRSTGYYEYQKQTNLGLGASPSYSFPISVDALTQFIQTQGEQYKTGKIASGLKSLFSTIAGGITTAVGIGTLNPLLIAGGVGGITGGVTGMAVNYASSMSKQKDLESTPDTINTLGSGYVNDGILDYTMYPYIVKYVPTETEMEMFFDYFYDNGYQVNRCCKWNNELAFNYDNNNMLDNNLFGRSLFNYIQLDEDITNKLTSNIPVVCKKKISNILQQGIKLWTFFDFDNMNFKIKPQLKDIFKYLLNNKYENAEM